MIVVWSYFYVINSDIFPNTALNERLGVWTLYKKGLIRVRLLVLERTGWVIVSEINFFKSITVSGSTRAWDSFVSTLRSSRVLNELPLCVIISGTWKRKSNLSFIYTTVHRRILWTLWAASMPSELFVQCVAFQCSFLEWDYYIYLWLIDMD